MRPQHVSDIRSILTHRQVGSVAMDAADIRTLDATLQELNNFGINLRRRDLAEMMAYAMDSVDANPLSPLTTPSINTAVQFLQVWVPGYIRVMTQPRKIDELVGRTTAGSWEDEEVVFQVMEPVGEAVPYSDVGNVPLASYNANYERRTIVRFEKGISVGILEELRSAKARINTSAEKRTSASLALEITRNRVGFRGYNNGLNRTYGLLNDPSLPAYVAVQAGASGSGDWSTKTYQEITRDLRTWAAAVRKNSKGLVNPSKDAMMLVLPVGKREFLTTTSDIGGFSVNNWLKENYSNWTIDDAPEFDGANGGADIAYLYPDKVVDSGTDDGAVIAQVVPAQMQTLGVEKKAKGYLEDYSNATAGIFVKRPFAVFRATGL